MTELVCGLNNITEQASVTCFRNDREQSLIETVAKEVRVALIYNGISHVVMMACPTALKEFAIGFSLSESIIESVRDIRAIEIETIASGVLVHIEIAPRCFMQLKAHRRSLAGRTGCGLCGVEQIEQTVKPIVKVTKDTRFDLNSLKIALANLHKHQTAFNLTGATHAAAMLSAEGDIISCFEDVGRHVALDKLIGHINIDKQARHAALLLTSRASFEMVQKAAIANISIIFAISSATSLAIDIANKSNITLVGFCRENRVTIYTHPQRLYLCNETLSDVENNNLAVV
ncbi:MULTISPECIES: formate dehydrogenase accessory sulfurtransferase FdhD [Shewanella]|uniref:Sulfur carrier protein FdhD n=1 Tax=Shewanella fidelis TaxID=173509 RepID=A0AAW8NQH8_9GAMM|nr:MULTISPECIES: formate dehydrogenase accessory sulfurtransferase FdhD [Shewanella]MDR8525362.1 formate dehydrogenase accessory sulfurtransferase FdhD [Shewanella fidelis]MDW4813601.1 formate dehydrogenase accessory sulfurtransferase FdhD [Shewanella fidelis]MDW4817741.1 formate dehydrogenase accessory sulfurtransferase FdhD [Shewanella fidelis]MDW4821808.1 formate dehydrogenase accessory sulfurtransferase FdhD [Shewanella fidelis]MDW4825929.1 formate dehydrogenase accessory sulfurtransferase